MTKFRMCMEESRALAAVLAVSLALVMSAVTAGCDGSAASELARGHTARVERGTVVTRVVASGAMAEVTSQDLMFPKVARLTEVNVKVGEKVAAGQVLARQDDVAFRQALSQRQAQLDQQQALLDVMVNGNTPAGVESSLDAQAALVAAARSAVALARQDVDNAVLRAPVAGTVGAVSGAVGEYIGAAQGTTGLAPCPNTPPPAGVAHIATGGASSGSVSGAPSATRPGGNAFIVLSEVNSFQVVVPLDQSDAVKLAPNQRVRVAFDAIPDLTREGAVLSIAPAGASISGVCNYYAAILLTETDPTLRKGQKAEAAVLVSSVDNVLRVPNPAVIKQGGRSTVNVPGPDGKPTRVPFQPGMVGDDSTEVKSGLPEGQEILLP